MCLKDFMATDKPGERAYSFPCFHIQGPVFSVYKEGFCFIENEQCSAIKATSSIPRIL